MRPSPKSIFLAIVVPGLPLVVTAGWLLGAAQAPDTSPGPSGATGFGSAPGTGTSWGSAGASLAPLPARKVAVQSRVSPGKRAGGGSLSPSSGGPSRADPPDSTATPRPEVSRTHAIPALTELPAPPSATAEPRPTG